MKKTIVFGLLLAIFAGGFSACKKTRRGKIAKDWTVSKRTEKTESPNPSGGISSTVLTYDGNKGTMVITSPQSAGVPSVVTKSGVINEQSYTIEKSGTWSAVTDVVWTSPFGGGTKTEAIVTKTAGSWSFLGKNKDADFKKNERMIFSILTSSTTNTTTTVDGTFTNTTTTSSNQTFSEGQSSKIYLIEESKNKSMNCSREINASNSGIDANGIPFSSSVTGSESMEWEVE